MQHWKITGLVFTALGTVLTILKLIEPPTAPNETTDLGVEEFESASSEEPEVGDMPIIAKSALEDNIIDGTEPLDDEILHASADELVE